MKTHPLSVSHLVMGLVFLGIAGSWSLHELGLVSAPDVEWLLPLTLVVAGAVGLLTFAARAMTGGRTDRPAGHAPAPTDPHQYDPHPTDTHDPYDDGDLR